MTVKIIVKGAVQGVGYRPFVLKKANEYGLFGQVKNIGAAVEIIASGSEEIIDSFTNMLQDEHPDGAFILSVEKTVLDEVNFFFTDFSIVKSTVVDLKSELPVFLPDIGVCDTCLTEMLSVDNRRYKYPLISCASCGPRISILDSLPYDRNTTTMSDFTMCPKCSHEYKNGRRTHAQTISCHDCGPFMILDYFDGSGTCHLERQEAVDRAVSLLKNNKILGLKGISGYQLICKPEDEILKRLRLIKGRENKPFAVIFSTIDKIKERAFVNAKEEELLLSSARPIVLLKAKKGFDYEVCKDSDYIGAFLPSAGIHRLLTDELGPLVCTSANISGQPMIIDDKDFKNTFFNKELCVEGILYHDRRINQPQDDSVMFVIEQDKDIFSSQFIRRARGFAPLPILCPSTCSDSSIMCFGGDLKSTFSFAKKDRVIMSQFIGDLEDAKTLDNFDLLINRYSKLFSFTPDIAVCDRHPLYHSSKRAFDYAKARNIKLLSIQHHYAHVLSVMAENSLHSCIGIAFDGTGFGDDGKVWGGEIFLCKDTEYKRAGHLSYIKLMGGDSAPKKADLVKNCYEYALGNNISDIVKAALLNNINTFETSSVGRLFDAVSALLEIKTYNSYEGECACSLEKEASKSDGVNYPVFECKMVDDEETIILDQLDLFKQIYECKASGAYDIKDIAYGFHMSLTSYILNVCSILKDRTKEINVCLSGGVFANRILLKNTVSVLRKEGFNVYWNRLVPSGDSGIALGQAYYGLLRKE
ncbi:MAG: carbamoyltransferase HypF [Butyrivibrio sp.]|uniref:carbamoyltransferase HypF n=1 Tax=Butyrivibrio sp. TaxID=28121 RepID=UPI001B1D6784|nr:carbamoyltransferase HypF [Butyrivibrio sp.]MBO6242527.1 carbamoyltransferase HypF [Butyrivibrio sp.]